MSLSPHSISIQSADLMRFADLKTPVRAMLKHLSLLVAAQTLCLLCGMMVYHQFLLTSNNWNERTQTWQQLDHQLSELIESKNGLPIEDLTETQIVDWLKSQKIAGSTGVLLVDQDFKVLAHRIPLRDQEQTWNISSGETLHWFRQMKSTGRIASVQGEFQLAGHPLIGAVSPLGSRNLSLITFQTKKEIPIQGDLRFESIGMMGWLAIFWISCLQSLSAFLVIKRILQEHHKIQGAVQEAARKSNLELTRTRDAVIIGLAQLADSRDNSTGQHLERISKYSTLLADALLREEVYPHIIDRNFVQLIGFSSALHDIGKVGIGDKILLKPGKLSQAERTEMKLHTLIGGRTLIEIERRLGSSNFLEMAREITMHHHEWWDGSGYPFGLEGAAIPLAARIVAVADVYDALSSERVYKVGYPHEECIKIITAERGTHFDPAVIDVFLRVEHLFKQIAEQSFRETETQALTKTTTGYPITEEIEEVLTDALQHQQSSHSLSGPMNHE